MPAKWMMTPEQPDSAAAPVEEESVGSVKTEERASKPKHPYQVLQSLPAEATPAQQDSAIQAVFKVENTHLSTRPDTLHLPGHSIGRDIKDVNMPLYYRETFFSKDSLLHPEIDGGRVGEAGDPVPYTIRGDDTITSLLFGCFFLALIAFAKSRRFISLQAKRLLHEPSGLTTEITETTGEVRFQFFLVLQTCLLLSIISFIYVQQNVADTFILSSQYQLIWIFFGVFAAYFCLRMLAYWIVNNVFFGRKKSSRWLKLVLFITSAEGVLLFPLVMLLSYFDLSVHSAAVYVAVVTVLVKILLLYKCFVAFFKQKDVFVQIILYFCTLEIVPLLTLWGTMAMIVDYLKINF